MEDMPKVEAHNVPEVEAPSRSQRVKISNIIDDHKVCIIEKFTWRLIPPHLTCRNHKKCLLIENETNESRGCLGLRSNSQWSQNSRL